MMITTGDSAEDIAKKMKKRVEPAFISYAKTTDASSMSVEGLHKYMKTTNKTFDVMAIKSKALAFTTGTLKAVASMGISLLASIAITGVISFFDEMNETSKEIAENIETAKSNIEELTSKFSNQKKTVSDVGKRYAELAQGVNQLTGENNSLSTESYNAFLEISGQLADIFPTLPRTFNNNGNAIVSLSGDVDTIVGSLDQLIEKERELINIQLTEELPDLFDDKKNNLIYMKKHSLN